MSDSQEHPVPPHARAGQSLSRPLRLHAYYDVPFLAPRVAAAIRALLPT
jgi:hypothetical protein